MRIPWIRLLAKLLCTTVACHTSMINEDGDSIHSNHFIVDNKIINAARRFEKY